MFQDFKLCENFLDKTSMMSFPYIESKSPVINFRDHMQTAVIDNFNIIDQCDNWSQLLFSELFLLLNFRKT